MKRGKGRPGKGEVVEPTTTIAFRVKLALKTVIQARCRALIDVIEETGTI